MKDLAVYVHCRKCVLEKPDNVSARDYARFEIGFLDGLGGEFVVRCLRHDEEVVSLPSRGGTVANAYINRGNLK
jgi:hypothetical protein